MVVVVLSVALCVVVVVCAVVALVSVIFVLTTGRLVESLSDKVGFVAIK